MVKNKEIKVEQGTNIRLIEDFNVVLQKIRQYFELLENLKMISKKSKKEHSHGFTVDNFHGNGTFVVDLTTLYFSIILIIQAQFIGLIVFAFLDRSGGNY